MARRRLTLKRIDPWSVLKFGFVVNLALLAIWLLGAAIIWFFVRRLGLIDQVCDIALEVGFTECGVNGGNLFRALLLLGLLGVVIQTGLLVFLAFLHNLIADLVGGLSFTFNDESGPVTPTVAAGGGRTGSMTARQTPPPPLRTEDDHQRTGSAVGTGAASGAGAPSTGPPPGSSTPPPPAADQWAPEPRPPQRRPDEPTEERRAEEQPPEERPPEQPTPSPGGSGSWDLFGPRGGSGGSGA